MEIKKVRYQKNMVLLTFKGYEDINLIEKYKEDIIVGTSIVIRNNHEIYFLIDGYKEEFRNVHSTHILKWAIIKKYFNNF